MPLPLAHIVAWLLLFDYHFRKNHVRARVVPSGDRFIFSLRVAAGWCSIFNILRWRLVVFEILTFTKSPYLKACARTRLRRLSTGEDHRKAGNVGTKRRGGVGSWRILVLVLRVPLLGHHGEGAAQRLARSCVSCRVYVRSIV